MVQVQVWPEFLSSWTKSMEATAHAFHVIADVEYAALTGPFCQSPLAPSLLRVSSEITFELGEEQWASLHPKYRRAMGAERAASCPWCAPR